MTFGGDKQESLETKSQNGGKGETPSMENNPRENLYALSVSVAGPIVTVSLPDRCCVLSLFCFLIVVK